LLRVGDGALDNSLLLAGGVKLSGFGKPFGLVVSLTPFVLTPTRRLYVDVSF